MLYKYFLIILSISLFSCDFSNEYKKRRISEVELQEINNFEYEDGKVIRMTVDDSLIYISSTPDNTIKVFDYTGRLLKTIGQKGEAPWENGTIWSYGKDSTSYWLHDYSKMALKKFDAKEDSLLLFRRFITRHNVLYKKDNSFIVPRFDDENGIFYISLYDAVKDSILKSFNISDLCGFSENLPAYGDFIFQGNLCKNNKGQSVFFCLYNGSFFFIDNDFENISYHNDVRNLSFIEPKFKEDVVKSCQDNIGIVAGAMDENYIYFLTPKHSKRKFKVSKRFTIDVYDIDTQKYIISYDLPKNNGNFAIGIAKTTKALIIAYNNGFVYIYNNDFVKEIDKVLNE